MCVGFPELKLSLKNQIWSHKTPARGVLNHQQTWFTFICSCPGPKKGQQQNAIRPLLGPFLPLLDLKLGEISSCVPVSAPAGFWKYEIWITADERGSWHTMQNEDMSGKEILQWYGWTFLVKPLWGQRDFSVLLMRILLGEQWSEKCQECLGHVYNSSRKSIN